MISFKIVTIGRFTMSHVHTIVRYYKTHLALLPSDTSVVNVEATN